MWERGLGRRVDVPREIWARRSGHFSMPATALHRSESYLSVPWHLSMPRGRALEGPTTRTRVPRPSSPLPTGPFLPFFGASDPKIFSNSGLRPEFGFWASEITGFSRLTVLTTPIKDKSLAIPPRASRARGYVDSVRTTTTNRTWPVGAYYAVLA